MNLITREFPARPFRPDVTEKTPRVWIATSEGIDPHIFYGDKQSVLRQFCDLYDIHTYDTDRDTTEYFVLVHWEGPKPEYRVPFTVANMPEAWKAFEKMLVVLVGEMKADEINDIGVHYLGEPNRAEAMKIFRQAIRRAA